MTRREAYELVLVLPIIDAAISATTPVRRKIFNFHEQLPVPMTHGIKQEIVDVDHDEEQVAEPAVLVDIPVGYTYM